MTDESGDVDRLRAAIEAHEKFLAKGGGSPSEFLAKNEHLRDLVEPLLATPDAGTSQPTRAPEWIGPYRILNTIGQGGMGTVYLAEQREPVRREVAIKVIKLGMDSKQVLARFALERQSLAVMSHPAIAKVLDAGITEQGQSYFVMEFVEGIPLTEFCDTHKLSLERRITIFQAVCRGVQHAHQKGIVHRDLKPGNILATRNGDEDEVKIIDFGLARATERQLVDQTIFTEQGQLIGTPEYMSPEQASGAALDIDTRTDVYSLGVVLYELLSGELPFTSQTLRTAGLAEIQRILEEVEPVKPSTKISSTADARASTWAGNRRLSQAALRKQLKGELDWIVLRAMAKEPERRYASASDLAQDLGRYLEFEPVEAGPPSATYRLRKFVRKRRGLVTAAVAVVLALVVGLGVALWQYARAARTGVELREQKDVAEQERNAALRTQSLLLADLANQRTRAGDAGSALCLALEALPDTIADPDRPYVTEAGVSLLNAIHALHERLVLRGHEDGVVHAAWSPDGSRVATISIDSTARIWDVHGSGQPIVLRGHDSGLRHVAWSPDGSALVTTSQDHTARLWDPAGNRAPIVLRGHEKTVTHAAWSPDGNRVATVSYDRTVRIWPVDGSAPVVLRGHEDEIWHVSWSPDGERIVTACSDRTARVWGADGVGSAVVLLGHEDRVFRAEWSRDSSRIVTACADRTARIWNATGGDAQRVLRGHDHNVTSAAWSPDGTRIVTASSDKTVRIWEADGNGAPVVLDGHEEGVRSAAWSPDASRILTASDDGTARIFGATGGPAWLVLRGHESLVLHAAWSPDGDQVLTTSSDTTARIWEARERGARVVLRGHEDRVVHTAWSPDGSRIATASGDATARIWDADGMAASVVLRGHEAIVSHVAWSPDGTRVVTASYDGTARIWNARDGGAPVVLRGHEAAIVNAAWSPDGTRVLTASWDKTARVWDVVGERPPVVLRGHEWPVYWAAWSPDGTRIVTASDDSTARVWDLVGNAAPVVLDHGSKVNHAAWSPDGTRIVTCSGSATTKVWHVGADDEPVALNGWKYGAWSPDGSRIVTAWIDRTAHIWNAQGGAEPVVLRGHEDLVVHAAWSPGGGSVATASKGASRVWDAETGEVRAVLSSKRSAGFAQAPHVAWSPDGSRIATTSADNTVQVLALFPSTQAMIDQALRVRPRQLSKAQRTRFFLDPK